MPSVTGRRDGAVAKGDEVVVMMLKHGF